MIFIFNITKSPWILPSKCNSLMISMLNIMRFFRANNTKRRDWTYFAIQNLRIFIFRNHILTTIHVILKLYLQNWWKIKPLNTKSMSFLNKFQFDFNNLISSKWISLFLTLKNNAPKNTLAITGRRLTELCNLRIKFISIALTWSPFTKYKQRCT